MPNTSPVLMRAEIDKSQELEEIVTGCVQSLSEDLKTHGIVLETSILDPIPSLDCDPDVIETLLTAILDNRACAVPAGGRLFVEVAAEGKCLRLSVTDTGWGIPLEAIPKMFGRDEGLRQQPRIGSARFQQILESQSGKLNIDRRPGQGSTMTLSFPISLPSRLQ